MFEPTSELEVLPQKTPPQTLEVQVTPSLIELKDRLNSKEFPHLHIIDPPPAPPLPDRGRLREKVTHSYKRPIDMLYEHFEKPVVEYLTNDGIPITSAITNDNTLQHQRDEKSSNRPAHERINRYIELIDEDINRQFTDETEKHLVHQIIRNNRYNSSHLTGVAGWIMLLVQGNQELLERQSQLLPQLQTYRSLDQPGKEVLIKQQESLIIDTLDYINSDDFVPPPEL